MVRVFLRYDGKCQCGCRRRIRSGEKWDADHAVALCNGGEHRENNLRPLLREHHKSKTREDLAIKSRTYKSRKRNLGIRKARWRPMPGTRASGIRKRMDGSIERWCD